MSQVPSLSVSRRTRSTPFTRRVEGNGVKGYTVYNRMLLPTVFEDVEADYWHLKQDVQVWDVACERQVELRGPDAAKLMQLLTPRDLSKMKNDQCYYTPVVDETGGMLNDPVTVRHNDEHWWVSLADSDLLFWIKGLAVGMKLNVSVDEPDVSPLGVQGPKSDELMKRVFGEEASSIRFFRHKTLPFKGKDYLIARSGYSKQGGFEIYVDGSENGEAIWDALFEAGKGLNVRAGCPNLIERIEGGLLSYGNDMTRENTPYECGLGQFCASAERMACIGAEALVQQAKDGPSKQIRGLSISGGRLAPCRDPWDVTTPSGEPVGRITSAAWSPGLDTVVAIGMVAETHWDAGTQVIAQTPEGEREATVVALPFG